MNLTCKITIEEAWDEYFDNSDFREVIQSGDFVYTESSYVANNGEQCQEKYALMFRAVEVHAPDDSTVRGDAKNIGSKKKQAKFYDINIQSELPKEIINRRNAAKKQFEKNSTTVKGAWERIYEYLRLEGANPQTFYEKTLVNESYFSKAKCKSDSPLTMHIIVSIAAGYQWGLHRAEELLKLAGLAFSPVSKQHDAYIFVLAAMSGYDINYMNTLLVKEGLTPLGSGSYSMEQKLK
ncbi:MAG: hypothetical protein FWC16_03880 [Defluviitaleaceae bacterium]|nr:hypothetical protein [Defluviitaleaceae bacterium]MCL2274044.1 hypothetical protein [Defluviitaleaceae bacterium]